MSPSLRQNFSLIGNLLCRPVGEYAPPLGDWHVAVGSAYCNVAKQFAGCLILGTNGVDEGIAPAIVA